MTGHAGQNNRDNRRQTALAGRPARRQGLVVWFNERKGYGIIRDDQGQDVFVDWTDILRPGFKTLHEGERVRFVHKTGEISLKAAEVVPLGQDVS